MNRIVGAMVFAAALLGPFTARAQTAETSALAMPRFSLVRVYVTDMARSERFYQDVFGMQPKRGSVPRERVLGFDDPGTPRLVLTITDAPRAGADFIGFAIAVADLEAVLSRTLAAGGSIVRPPGAPLSGGVRLAFIRDPDGAQIELIGMAAGQ